MKKYLNIEDISVYKLSFKLSNCVWDVALKWNYFEKSTVDRQLVSSIDSIFANIAEGLTDISKKTKLFFIDIALLLSRSLLIGYLSLKNGIS